MSCCVNPSAIAGVEGVTTIDCSVAGVTVMLVLPVTVPDVAMIEDAPSANPVVIPETVTPATEGTAVAQATEAVMSCKVPSE